MNPADLELLERAARAAGMPWDQWVIDGNDQWNPITDDGDALRLATRLKLCISHWPDQTPPHVMIGYRTGPDSGSNWFEDYGADADAATRRAIVCAAADMAPEDGDVQSR